MLALAQEGFLSPCLLSAMTLFDLWTSLVAQMLKASAYNAGDLGSIPGSGRSSGEGNGNHSSILAWEIPWTEEPGGLQSMGLQSQMGLSD